MDRQVNKTDMTLVSIPPGEFRMGQEGGRDEDETPVHPVHIRQSFQIAQCPVTNAQFEAFDPDHREFRGIRGVSTGDEEAVMYVSWHDAKAYCRWLSEREGKPYRLPTEAEWEYVCRAGTTTPYWTGEELPVAFHRNQPVEGDWDSVGRKADDDHRDKKGKFPIDLTVGKTSENPWGIRDIHGIVEEWCEDTGMGHIRKRRRQTLLGLLRDF